MKGKKKLVIMVSSTVYGIEELLDRIYTLLTDYGYEVWMSHKGILPVRSDRCHGDLFNAPEVTPQALSLASLTNADAPQKDDSFSSEESPFGPHSPAPPHYANRADFVSCSVEILYSPKQPGVCRDYRQTSPKN